MYILELFASAHVSRRYRDRNSISMFCFCGKVRFLPRRKSGGGSPLPERGSQTCSKTGASILTTARSSPVYVRVCTCMHACSYLSIYLSIYIHTYIHTHICLLWRRMLTLEGERPMSTVTCTNTYI